MTMEIGAGLVLATILMSLTAVLAALALGYSGAGLVLATILMSLTAVLAALALGYSVTRDLNQRQVEVAAATSRSSDATRPRRFRNRRSAFAFLVVVAALAPAAISYGEPRECRRLCAIDFEACKKSCADVGAFDGCEVECGWVDDGCLRQCAEAQRLTDHPYAPPQRRARTIDARSTR